MAIFLAMLVYQRVYPNMGVIMPCCTMLYRLATAPQWAPAAEKRVCSPSGTTTSHDEIQEKIGYAYGSIWRFPKIGVPPNHHPFRTMGLSHLFWGTPMTSWKAPYLSTQLFGGWSLDEVSINTTKYMTFTTSKWLDPLLYRMGPPVDSVQLPYFSG